MTLLTQQVSLAERRSRLAACSSSGRFYRRRDLHDEFGGQQQGGIVTPASTPIILLITGEAGLGYGYNDKEVPDGTFVYYGEGQTGPMSFVRGNRAIRDHAESGRDVHLLGGVTSQLLLLRVDPLLVAQVATAKAPGLRKKHRRGLPDRQQDRRCRMVHELCRRCHRCARPCDPSPESRGQPLWLSPCSTPAPSPDRRRRREQCALIE